MLHLEITSILLSYVLGGLNYFVEAKDVSSKNLSQVRITVNKSDSSDSLNESIALVCATDQNYAMPLAVTIYSALKNLRNKQQHIDLFVIESGLSKSTKQRIAKTLDSAQMTIHWVKLSKSQIDKLVVLKGSTMTNYHLTIATYYRLLIPQILPPEIKKVIYLDSDIIVKGDLGQLWNIDIGDNYVLAVQDDHQLNISMAGGLRNYQELGMNPNSKYFNAGLLVINLEKWRSDNIGLKVIEYIQQNKDYILFNDQDGLNGVLADRWGQLNPQWNQMPRVYTFSSWQESQYDEQTFNSLLYDPFIIHYATSSKPWHKNCNHPQQDLFYQYLDQTAWSGWRNTIWRRLLRRVRKMVANFLQRD